MMYRNSNDKKTKGTDVTTRSRCKWAADTPWNRRKHAEVDGHHQETMYGETTTWYQPLPGIIRTSHGLDFGDWSPCASFSWHGGSYTGTVENCTYRWHHDEVLRALVDI